MVFLIFKEFFASLILKALSRCSTGGGCFPPPHLCKIRSRHPRELKLTGLIALFMFYKICKFRSSTITNDVIMTSLPKPWQNSDLRKTKQIISQSKGTDESYPKIYFLLILSHFVKRYGHVCQFLTLFTMSAHQTWSCHVTQEANSKIFCFVLILHLIFQGYRAVSSTL